MPTRPKIADDDHSKISVTLDGEELQAWFYADDADRREKMRAAWYFCDGFLAAQEPRPDKPRPLSLEEYKENRRYGIGIPTQENRLGRSLQDGECD